MKIWKFIHEKALYWILQWERKRIPSGISYMERLSLTLSGDRCCCAEFYRAGEKKLQTRVCHLIPALFPRRRAPRSAGIKRFHTGEGAPAHVHARQVRRATFPRKGLGYLLGSFRGIKMRYKQWMSDRSIIHAGQGRLASLNLFPRIPYNFPWNGMPIIQGTMVFYRRRNLALVDFMTRGISPLLVRGALPDFLIYGWC